MSNFKFLTSQAEYALFSSAAVEAEKVYHSSPAMLPWAAGRRWSWR